MGLKNRRTLDMDKNNFEDFLFENMLLISFVSSLIIMFFYFKGIFENIKFIIGDIITFTSIVFAVVSVFLSLFIYLEDSSLGERKKKYYPQLNKEIYNFLRKTIYATIATLLLSLLISVVKFNDWLVVKFILGFSASLAFTYMTIGMIYLIKFSITLAINDITFKDSHTDKIE